MSEVYEKKVGYVMKSAKNNNLDPEALKKELGVEELFIENASNPTRKEYKEIYKLFDSVEEEDVVVVDSIFSFGYDEWEIMYNVDVLSRFAVNFVALEEGIDTRTTAGWNFSHFLSNLANLVSKHIVNTENTIKYLRDTIVELRGDSEDE